MAENRKMMQDITFIISDQSDKIIKIETYHKDFRYLNCEIPAKDLITKMRDLSYKLNNHPDGCYGCLFCID